MDMELYLNGSIIEIAVFRTGVQPILTVLVRAWLSSAH